MLFLKIIINVSRGSLISGTLFCKEKGLLRNTFSFTEIIFSFSNQIHGTLILCGDLFFIAPDVFYPVARFVGKLPYSIMLGSYGLWFLIAETGQKHKPVRTAILNFWGTGLSLPTNAYPTHRNLYFQFGCYDCTFLTTFQDHNPKM